MRLELWYQRSWGTLNVVSGILFSVIFILGAIVLDDVKFFLYLILSGGNIAIGIVRLKKPYVIVQTDKGNTKNQGGEISVLNIFGAIQYHYRYSSRTEISVKNNRLYHNGKKLRFNSWFVNPRQWQKVKRYFEEGILPAEELQDF